MKKIRSVATAVLLLLVPGKAMPPAKQNGTNETRYTVLMMGNKAGFETSTPTLAGGSRLYYEFNDRGRGPKIAEDIVVDGNGIPVITKNSGIDYYKAPVEEHYSLRSGNAVWKNRAEEGRQQVSAKVFYVSISGVPEETAILARALLVAPGGKMRLLPAGEAAIEKRGEIKVEVNGRSRTVVQYAITGLDFTPTPIWLEPDGKFFASVSGSWFSVVLEGWEPVVDTLAKAQDEFDNQRAVTLAKAVAHKPADSLAFVHAALFDSETATVHRDRTVVITGNIITAVGEDGKVSLPQNAQVIDATNKTLLPGLWDMHVHLQPNDGLLHMAAGVTSVRDMANDTDRLLEMRSRFDKGTEIGPRVLMAGFLDGRGPYAGPTKVFADSEQEARDNIDKYAKLGYVQIKIYSSIKPELVPPIAKMAHDRGMRVSGHVPAFMTAEQFVLDGVDEIQHMNFIFLNFMFDRVKDTRTPARFTEVAAHGAEIDPRSAPVKAFIKLLQEHRTVLDPTLNVFEGIHRPAGEGVCYLCRCG